MPNTVLSGKRCDILGIDFDLVDYHSVLETILRWRSDRKRSYIVVTNPHSVLLCRRDRQMAHATAAAGLTLPDGVGIIIAASLLGRNHNGRVTGPTLMLKLCDWGRRYGFRHYFYGGAELVADKLANRLAAMFPQLQVAGTYCPPFKPLSERQDCEIIKRINSARPDILWVGLGAPKQEKWMAQHLGKINAVAMIGVGAAFDFHSGNVKWTPACFRKIGLEWAYRLAQQPTRMWKRNLDSPIFLAKVIWQRLMITLSRLKLNKIPPSKDSVLEDQLR